MKKIILALAALIIGFGTSVPVIAEENLKLSDSLHFQMLTDCKEDYNLFKLKYMGENYVDAINLDLGFKKYEKLERSEIEADKAYKDVVWIYPQSSDYLTSKEAFLKEYNSSGEYSWNVPIMKGKEPPDILSFRYSKLGDTNGQIDSLVDTKVAESNADFVRKTIDENNFLLKKDSEVYLVHAPIGTLAFIISDNIDYVINITDIKDINSFNLYVDEGYFKRYRYDIINNSAKITNDDITRLNNLLVAKGAVLNSNDLEKCAIAEDCYAEFYTEEGKSVELLRLLSYKDMHTN